MTSVLVTGAGGLIGSRVADALEGCGYQVTRLIHRPQPGAIAYDLRLPLNDLPAHDWVVHLAGGYAGASLRALRRTDLRMARNLLCWGKRRGVGNWVFASAAEIYGHVCGEATEQSPLRPLIPYGNIKLEIEKLFAEKAQGRVVILRIGEVYGRKSRLMTELGRRLRSGFCPWPGSGRVPVSFVHVDDVAQAFARAVERAGDGVSLYNVADAEPSNWRDFVCTAARLLGAPAPVFLPPPLVRVYAFGHVVMRRLTGRDPILTGSALKLLITPKALATAKIERELGFVPRYRTIRLGLEETFGLSHHTENGAAQGAAAPTSA